MARTIKVDLFTDVVCPWCLVGSARLDIAIAQLPADVTVDVENHPFYLDPDTPPEGYEVGPMLQERYGREPREMWARVEGEARKSGIELDLSQQPRTFRTQKAHTLVRLARSKGTQHALANAIAAAYFLGHRQVNEEGVLADIAAEHGFTRAEALAAIGDTFQIATTHEQAIWAQQQGMRGVPFFIFDDKFAMSGCQPQDVFAAAFAKVFEAAA